MKNLFIKATKYFLTVCVLLTANSFVSAQENAQSAINKNFLQALNDYDWGKVQQLISQGADVNALDVKTKASPLSFAAEAQKLEIINLLIQKGAKVNVADENGLTPLHRAVSGLFAKPNIAVLKALIVAGADADAQDNKGETALMYVVADENIDISFAKMLIENGANPNLTNNENNTALQLAIIKERKEAIALLKPLTKTIESLRSQFPGKFLKKDGIEIYYEVRGAKTGIPLFVLNGGPGFDHQYFLANSAFEELGNTRPIIFYDQRGTGNSPKLIINQTATMQDQAEDLEALIKLLGYKKIDLAGHSFGGFLAMAYAAIFPEQVSHLILIDSMPSKYSSDYSKFETEYPKEFEEMEQKRVEGELKGDRKAMRESLVAYMKMLFYSPQKRDTFIAASTSLTYNADVNSKVNVSAEIYDLTPDLKNLAMPVLIIHGRHDANIALESSENIQKTIPKSKLVIFEESGHLPFYEEPQKFVQVIQSFLNG